MRPKALFKTLYKKYGPQFWWPVIGNKKEAVFEIALGAILTQNTSWHNVEKTIGCLKKENLFSPFNIKKCSKIKLERCLKSSGYYRQKSKKIKIFSHWLIDKHKGKLKKFFNSKKLPELRQELLELWGVGRETADSILLYAGAKPIFVIDAYTKRLCAKNGIEFSDYDEYRIFFEKDFKEKTVCQKVKIFNEFHALIVRWGKEN